jgi:hypothetical protein
MAAIWTQCPGCARECLVEYGNGRIVGVKHRFRAEDEACPLIEKKWVKASRRVMNPLVMDYAGLSEHLENAQHVKSEQMRREILEGFGIASDGRALADLGETRYPLEQEEEEVPERPMTEDEKVTAEQITAQARFQHDHYREAIAKRIVAKRGGD